MADKPRVRVPAGSQPRLTTDSFANVVAHIGQQTANISSAAGYKVNPISRIRTQLEWMYRGSWLVRKVVDQPADDMTRAGIDFDTDLPPDAVEKLLTSWTKHKLWDSLRDTIKWARLYGGAVAYIMIDGQDPTTPLRMDTISEGSFKGLLVLDRWMVNPILSKPIQDLGPMLGEPSMYETTTTTDIPSMQIHYSRLIRFDGDPLPYWQRITENGWSVSVVEQLYDRMVAFDSATQGAAQLVYKAHLRTYKVPGLREMIAAGGAMYQAFMSNMNMIRVAQSIEGLTVIDGEDEIEYHTNSAFSGLSDALTQFGQQLSGACGIPLVILFGQSPSGFSTGETDVRNYYDRINAKQRSELEEPVRKLVDILCRSTLGQPMPDNFSFSFNSLWQPTQKEKADTASTVTTTIVAAHGEGLLSTQTAMKELRQSSRETGIYSNITDEEIEAADDTLPMPGESPDALESAAGKPDAAPSPLMGHNGGPPLTPKPDASAAAQPKPGVIAPQPQRTPSSPKAQLQPDKDGKLVVPGTPSNVRVRLDPSVAHLLKLNQK